MAMSSGRGYSGTDGKEEAVRGAISRDTELFERKGSRLEGEDPIPVNLLQQDVDGLRQITPGLLVLSGGDACHVTSHVRQFYGVSGEPGSLSESVIVHLVMIPNSQLAEASHSA
jgi:hypothetical protein